VRGKVREVEPPVDTRDFEELVAEEVTTAPAASPADSIPGGRPRLGSCFLLFRPHHATGS
jgi:hypothetical protein